MAAQATSTVIAIVAATIIMIMMNIPPLGAPSGRSIRKALRSRLALAIMDDRRAAVGRTSGAHSKGDTDGRARRGRPRGQTEFMQRWGSVAQVEAGKCTPRTRWIETGRPPD